MHEKLFLGSGSNQCLISDVWMSEKYRFVCPLCHTLEGHQFQDKDWAFDVRCEKSEPQYVVVWRLVTEEEWNKRRRLSRTDEELLWRFCWKELKSRGAVVGAADLNHWLNEYVFEGWWRSVNQAKQAVVDLVEKIAAAEPIEELRWCCVK